MPLGANSPLRLLSAIVLVGVVVGGILSLLQSLDTHPLLIQAETFQPRAVAAESGFAQAQRQGAKPPAGLAQRARYRLASDITLSVGFALLLGAAMRLHNHYRPAIPVTAARGILWGLGGFAVFYLAPGAVYPPRTPAVDALLAQHGYSLVSAQLLWLAAVSSTLLGLITLCYGRGHRRWLGALLLLVPPLLATLYTDRLYQLIDAQQVPRLVQLTEQHFRYSAHLTNLLFWIILGVLCAAVCQRSAKSARH